MPVAKKSARAASKPRRAASGDTTGAKTQQRVGVVVAREALAAAQGAQNAAIKDIVTRSADKAVALKTFLAGSSPDDVAAVREMLRHGDGGNGKTVVAPDDELARDWRTGGYPYKNPLSRKRYETQK